ncbi:hypothetical protein [Paenibacillus sp. 453mf]|uniref:hypothetical protein n=1 Tax=Paenibacillus sp. 453mf TaxID=1761874 RepID=UPI0008E094C4|nr:hypothetical protein [Paenibacillus sp. 453mf]SFS85520.1 hypothetical protein SAMN04488601_10599 [Paenibacillus sp. 453mf]
MKRMLKLGMAAVAIGGGIWIGSVMNITADGASVNSQPGTADDPVVTKSYVDQAIQNALNGGGSAGPSEPSTPSAGEELKIVVVKPGQRLVAGAGTEFIVRSGKAVIYSADANGVADLTVGQDLTNGTAITNNHLLSFPREGRGIEVQQGNKYNLTVMVRGNYNLFLVP